MCGAVRLLGRGLRRRLGRGTGLGLVAQLAFDGQSAQFVDGVVGDLGAVDRAAGDEGVRAAAGDGVGARRTGFGAAFDVALGIEQRGLVDVDDQV